LDLIHERCQLLKLKPRARIQINSKHFLPVLGEFVEVEFDVLRSTQQNANLKQIRN